MAAEILTGRRFGRLIVNERVGKDKHGNSTWMCACDCGTDKVCGSNNLKGGKIISCGCYRQEALRRGREQLHKDLVTHGKTGTREHHIWLNIIYRCESPKCNHYYRYGGRGIKICERWRHSFEAFLADMGESPTATSSIDRIDNDGNYEPSNCRWATKKEQANNRSCSVILEFRGERRSMTEWCQVMNLHKATLSKRLSSGWSVEKALTTRPKNQAVA